VGKHRKAIDGDRLRGLLLMNADIAKIGRLTQFLERFKA
jgi:hypothetical protein